jgi:hypothetical protein
MKTQRTLAAPALEPVSLYTVEFTTPDHKKYPSSTVTRTVAGTDEVAVAKAVRGYFDVDRINSVTRTGSIYVTQ